MKDWTKLASYDNSMLAELRKENLEQNGIMAILVQKKDSAFLVGEVELFVETKNIEQASALIDEFEGWSQINSYYKRKNVDLVRELLTNNGIESKLLAKKDSPFLVENYVLLVSNQSAQLAKPILDEVDGWTQVATSDSMYQAQLKESILFDNQIDAILLKKRASDLHLEAVEIYVEDAQAQKALSCLDKQKGWALVASYNKPESVIIKENLLLKKGIDVLKNTLHIGLDTKVTQLFVREKEANEANDILQESIEWIKLKTFESTIEAEFYKQMLEENNIEAVLLIHKDSAFLIGDIELYIEADHREQALKLLLN